MTKIARVKRKATLKAQRRAKAQVKVSLATILGLIQGMMIETEKYLSIEKKQYQDQIKRVWRWSNECFNQLDLGKHSLTKSLELVTAFSKIVERYIPPAGEKTVGDYAMVWLALGYLADEAVFFVEDRDQKKWTWLASVVDTWTGYCLDNADKGRDYEAEAGELAERVRKIVWGWRR